MSSLNHPTMAGSTREGPSSSETAVGGEGGTNIAPKDTATTEAAGQPPSTAGLSSSKPGSAEAAAEKLYEERMEDEYAKREGGA
ncbi:hypothetical protein DOTSEDRAFT_41454 [Dothistroma septosporum NZE10]|uniref:Uncharacterized protein n=1 Tax=Dothistroma septosporum (strain NZE10 / CBS 128990) TaxID=675120 RepID=N1Q3J4_DOTSN|nr:hypothetical protein DOTSEDRAFT_41454 [Dothistroma septosporum NZE10]